MDHAAATARVDEVLAADRRFGRRESGVGWSLVVIGVGIACGAALWAARSPESMQSAVTVMLLGFCFAVLAPMLPLRWIGARHHRAVLSELLEVDEPVAALEALQTIADEMRLSRNLGQISAARAELLSNLSAADAQRLSSRWPSIAHRVLVSANDPLRMLDAKGRWDVRTAPYARLAGLIGDASHVQPLKRLAEMVPRNAEQEAIRLEAEKALSALLARLDAGGDRLLRPADGEAEALLRPTGEAGPGDEALLLRPAGAAEDQRDGRG